MDINRWITQAKELSFSALAKTSEAVGAGVGFVQSAIGRSWIYGSTESSASYDDHPVDEKHYFLIPNRRADVGYSLYSMRCLPDGVPPINDLPKRRVLHLPNAHATATVEHIIAADARQKAEQASPCSTAIGSRLNDLADQIDRLDGKVFNGVLLIGGLVALVNPLAGAAVAMKALIPSMGLILSKYGLKYAGDTATGMETASRIKKAENDVLRQFRDASTSSLVNPLLSQLDRALETNETEYDPLLTFDSNEISFGDQDRDRFLTLTYQAIANTYDDIIETPDMWDSAQLGPEDIRFLKLIRNLATHEDHGT